MPPTASRRICLLLLLSFALVAGRVVAEPQAPHPKAPKETAQYSFLIGAWECIIQRMGPDGVLGPERSARWTGRYILDGWAIEDVWESTGPDGSPFQGVNIRSFNPKTHVWDNRWLSSRDLQWAYYSSEKVGETMVMTGGEGVDARGPFIDRNTFYDIKPESWSWRKDRSWDGGDTWVEGIATISAKRLP